jgi:putative MATE family efflux protein
MVLISMMTVVDTVMVSSIGPFAIAATGLTNQPRMIFMAFFFSLNTGVTAVVSRRKGENNIQAANKALAQAMMLCVSMSGILCAVSFLVAEPLLMFAGAQEDTIAPALVYFRITMVGMMFASLGLTINAAQRGCGNTQISMRTNLIANIVNVCFNYLLINGVCFSRGSVFSARPSPPCSATSPRARFPSTRFPNPSGFYIRPRDCLKYDRKIVRLLFGISSSAALEQLFVRVGFFAYTKIVASLGTVSMATHQICMSIINLSYSFGDGLGTASASLVGQSLGGRRPDVAAVYGKASQRVGLLVSLGLVILFTAGGRMLMGLFTNETEIIDIGQKLLFVVAASSPGQISNVVFTGSLRGAGDTKYVAYTSL